MGSSSQDSGEDMLTETPRAWSPRCGPTLMLTAATPEDHWGFDRYPFGARIAAMLFSG